MNYHYRYDALINNIGCVRLFKPNVFILKSHKSNNWTKTLPSGKNQISHLKSLTTWVNSLFIININNNTLYALIINNIWHSTLLLSTNYNFTNLQATRIIFHFPKKKRDYFSQVFILKKKKYLNSWLRFPWKKQTNPITIN